MDITFSEEQEREVLAAAPLTNRDIVRFAEKFRTHPAIIMGRFHRKLIPYHLGRAFVVPGTLLQRQGMPCLYNTRRKIDRVYF